MFILRIDSKGRVTLPIRIRAKLKVLEGESIEGLVTEDGFLIRKKRKKWI